MQNQKLNNAGKTVLIAVAAHKQVAMPSDSMYIPLHVGAENSAADFGYTGDNTGDNISALNPYFCELTGLYWLWKNTEADYKGLVHYRRVFVRHAPKISKGRSLTEAALKYEDIKPYLGKIKVFVPKKNKYYIETLYSHYAHTFDGQHLDDIRKVLADICSDYVESFDAVMKQRSGYMFNMMIMEDSLFEEYCAWLFKVIFELKHRYDSEGRTENLSDFHKRLYGRVSERLLNIWLHKKVLEGVLEKTQIMELPVIYSGKVNWWKKGTGFLRAKFFGTRYEKSF